MVGVAVPRKLVRGPGNWTRNDFYLGLELCWGALAACLLQFYSIAQGYEQKVTTAAVALTQVQVNATVTIATLIAMLLVLALHQNWEASLKRGHQIFLLGGVGNAIGIMLFASFVLFTEYPR
ncbi:hypothetical protein ACPW96_19395 [Micromonospora sp. DT81.3]|uniref:hypothetical protein n=1 Tax=Micromonospora sp. DT81.3 TaxID=3416523 RepID=UPI003CECE3BA